MMSPGLSLPPRTSNLATVWAYLEEGLDTIMMAESLKDIPVQYVCSTEASFSVVDDHI